MIHYTYIYVIYIYIYYIAHRNRTLVFFAHVFFKNGGVKFVLCEQPQLLLAPLLQEFAHELLNLKGREGGDI